MTELRQSSQITRICELASQPTLDRTAIHNGGSSTHGSPPFPAQSVTMLPGRARGSQVASIVGCTFCSPLRRVLVLLCGAVPGVIRCGVAMVEVALAGPRNHWLQAHFLLGRPLAMSVMTFCTDTGPRAALFTHAVEPRMSGPSPRVS